MERHENLERLNRFETGINDANYLHHKFLFADIKYAIAQYATGQVLDMGCGNKPYLPLFAQKSTGYTGTDIAQSSAQCVDIICSCTDVPLPNEGFDTVFTTQVLEHVADHQQMLREAFRMLKPGGKIILTAPMYWEHHEEPYDFFRFTRYGMAHLFSDAGFKVLEIKANGGKWALTGQTLQNNLRSSFIGKKGWKRKLLKHIYFLFRLKWLINIVFSWLEKTDPDESTTLNWLVVAEKPGAESLSS
jgi:SAM-dependent methyltransferase